MDTDFDVVIIGSGAGGAPIAYTLANEGKKVLVLEKGPLFRSQFEDPRGISDFKRDEMFATGAEKRIQIPGMSNLGESYYSSEIEPDLNDEPHVYQVADGDDAATIEGWTSQVVGGGTVHYGGVSLRFSPLDFQLGSFNQNRNDLRQDPNDDVRREARDWPISYDDLEPFYGTAERLIGINGTAENQEKPFGEVFYQQPLEPNPISNFAAVGMDALGMSRYRTPLAVITQDHAPSGRTMVNDPVSAKSGYVNRYGNPLALKSSTWVSLLNPISNLPNFNLWANCHVTGLECNGARISRVNFIDPSGQRRFVRGNLVIVACSAIESVRLLKLSATMDSEFDRRINQNDLLGRYFLTHCFGGAEAVMPARFDKSVTLDSDWATDFCGTEDFIRENGLWAGAAIYNNTSDQAQPLSLAFTHGSTDLDTFWRGFVNDMSLRGPGLTAFLDRDFQTRLSISFMGNQLPLPSNRIELHPNVRDKWGLPVAYVIKDWHTHDIVLMDTMAEQCARILRFGGDGGQGNFQIEGFGGVYMAENARARIANHILGGARFGSNRNDSVLDTDCKAWDFDNLYVTDGCFMPTSGGANPTLTIQANAFRVAEILKNRV